MYTMAGGRAAAAQCRELDSVLPADLEGAGRGGGRPRGQLVHTVVQQKLTQHCKAVILLLNKKKGCP